MGKGDKKTKRGKFSKKFFWSSQTQKVKKVFKIVHANICVYYGKPMLKKEEALRIEKEQKKYSNHGITKDHVPQKCLFDKYLAEYKNQRFTVPPPLPQM